VETDIIRQDEAQLISRFARIPLEKRELLVNLVIRRLGCEDDRRMVSRHLYLLFLRADLLKRFTMQ
jgi:hypothetical protein